MAPLLLTDEELRFIPTTADGRVIYPGMIVYIPEPFSVEQLTTAKVYCVLESVKGTYACVLEENRYFDGENWQDGNTEYTSAIYAARENCIAYVVAKERDTD